MNPHEIDADLEPVIQALRFGDVVAFRMVPLSPFGDELWIPCVEILYLTHASTTPARKAVKWSDLLGAILRRAEPIPESVG